MSDSSSSELITPTILLSAYAAGLFPMADGRTDRDIFWVEPDHRGILPLDRFHISRSLRKSVRHAPFEVRFDSDFAGVIRACAESRAERPLTWISRRIETLYTRLHHLGFAHSVECWKEGRLVGGLYGVALGGAFFGESMFHRQTDASKIALVYLVAALKQDGFLLLDTQFQTGHLRRFGSVEIARVDYLMRLKAALERSPSWSASPVNMAPDAVLHAITHIS